ncbi:MAG: hypothetical protein DCO96_15695 [Fluviicola sp. XM-24bin1]|nr:MAG: hypothetical protein DCO96_15695 [Fluviicola sp. XM-24bin1]
MKQIIYFAFAAIAITACQKEEVVDEHNHDHSSNEPISITFNSPNENETFNFNEEVSVSGWISRNGQIHGYTVELINQSNQDSVLYSHDVHDHGSEMEFSDLWTNNLQDTSSVLIRITAFGDHEASTSEIATRLITCNGQ